MTTFDIILPPVFQTVSGGSGLAFCSWGWVVHSPLRLLHLRRRVLSITSRRSAPRLQAAKNAGKLAVSRKARPVVAGSVPSKISFIMALGDTSSTGQMQVGRHSSALCTAQWG